MDYSIDVTDKQTLYFDCFDKLSNSLSEDINGSFMVTVNGQVNRWIIRHNRATGF